jgi:hypothetical protein
MKVKSAIKKVEKRLGVKMKPSGWKYRGIYNGYEISFAPNGGRADNEETNPMERDACSFHARRLGDVTDIQTDYFTGSYYDNVTQLIKLVDDKPCFPVGTLVKGKNIKRNRYSNNGIANRVGVVVGISGRDGKSVDVLFADTNEVQEKLWAENFTAAK